MAALPPARSRFDSLFPFPSMSSIVIAVILAATLITATISGIFGMAGGLLLMGVLAAFTPVATAMVLHGFIQIIANSSRAVFLWKHISWPLIRRYALGVGAAVALIALVSWRPTQSAVFVMLGLSALLVWIPRRLVEIDVGRRGQAELCGFLVQTLNTLAGVAGPLLDLFFVKTLLPRQTVVATKAATQVMAHAVKIAFWGLPLVAMLGSAEAQASAQFPPFWALLAVIPLSLSGTWLGGRVLERMTDTSFREWTKWIVTVTGAVYLARGVWGFS